MHANCPHFLRENIKKFCEKKMWPPCSPDLNSLDFSVWPYLERTVCSKKHSGIESLKRIWKEHGKICRKKCCIVCNDVPRRLREVIEIMAGTLNKLIAIFFVI